MFRSTLSSLRSVALICVAFGTRSLAWGTDIPSPASVNATELPDVTFNGTGAMGIPAYKWSLRSSPFDFTLINRTADTAPVTVAAGAPSNSLKVNDMGFVGLNTFYVSAAPQRSLHISGGLAGVDPTIRFQAASIFQNIWDIEVGSESFRIVDPDKGTTPFKLLDDAPSNSLLVDTNGSIGLGTALPNRIGGVAGNGKWLNLRADGPDIYTGVASLVAQGNFGSHLHLVHNNAPANQRIIRLQCSSGLASFHVLNDTLASYAVPNVLNIKMSNGNIGLRVLSPAHPLHLASGAHCTAGGVWTNASSRELKENVRSITSEEARQTVRALQPVGYRYKSQPDEDYVGFIAEDVPEMVASNDRKSLAPMDVVAVLTKVVQDQDLRHNEQERMIAELKQTNDKQRELLDSLSKRLANLERKSDGK